jgi:putative membrane protein
VNREAQAIVLLLLGGALLHAGSTDLYLRYVQAGLRPLLLAAGVVLVLGAVATLWYGRRRSRVPQVGPSEREHDDGHGHGHRGPGIAWLLLLPLFALILVGPPALGSYSALRTGTALQQPLFLPPLAADGPLELSVVDYAGRAVFDHGHSLGTRPVVITGFIAVDDQGRPFLTRMFRNCCAADARPIKVGLTGAVPPVLQPDAWLEVTGTYTDEQTSDPVNNGPIPFIDVSQARPVPAPEDEYESW